MTLEDVSRAKQTLEAEGTYPSHAAIRRELGYGSRRDIARLMQHLTTEAGSPEVIPSDAVPSEVIPSAVPPPVHALARAHDAWKRAEAEEWGLGQAHTAMRDSIRVVENEIVDTVRRQRVADTAPLVKALRQREAELRTDLARREATRQQVAAQRAQMGAQAIALRETFAALKRPVVEALAQATRTTAQLTAADDPRTIVDLEERLAAALAIVAAAVGAPEAQRLLAGEVSSDWLKG